MEDMIEMKEEPFDKKILGAQIRKFAQIRGWSPEDLALQLEVAPATVRRLMAGETAPDLYNCGLLANLFKASSQ